MAEFVAQDEWLRSHFKCSKCGSVPRERAIMAAIEMIKPKWRELEIHEASPSPRATSLRLKTECKRYSFSQFDEKLPRGGEHPTAKWRNEDLEDLTFADKTFDLFVLQDVFEHVFNPDKALKEIERVLRPGGALVMTVPLVHHNRNPSARRAKQTAEGVVHLKEPQYHGNPHDPNGSLVTIDWGHDILAYMAAWCGLRPAMYVFDDLSRGLRAKLLEVVVGLKVEPPNL